MLSYNIQLPHVKNTIFDVAELLYLKLVVVGSLDKQLTILNMSKRHIVLIIDMNQGGVHSFVVSETYQVLLSAGFENPISVYSIDPNYFDSLLVGKMVGHSSMVTALEVIEGTPMVVSADD